MPKKSRNTKRRKVKGRRAARKRKVHKPKKAARKKPTKRKGARRPKARAAKKGPKLPAEPIGRVTHYFPKVRATALLIEKEGIRVGDVLYFKGHTTSFKQRVDSLQINHQSVTEAGAGEEVGIQVRSRTREHDLVFKL